MAADGTKLTSALTNNKVCHRCAALELIEESAEELIEHAYVKGRLTALQTISFFQPVLVTTRTLRNLKQTNYIFRFSNKMLKSYPLPQLTKLSYKYDPV